MTGREHSTTGATAECSGHGVRCALNCRRKWRWTSNRSWEGVTLENGRVVELDLKGIGLTDAVPAGLGRLSALRVLDVYCNQLTSMPAEIGQLTSLETLRLGREEFAGGIELGSLKNLYLHNNELTSVPGGGGQTHVAEELGLATNKLTSVPVEIGQLTSLEWLNLGGNQLASLPAEIGQLASLEWLHLGDNRLTSVPANRAATSR